jgi:lysophospholipase L1-like esterase
MAASTAAQLEYRSGGGAAPTRRKRPAWKSLVFRTAAIAVGLLPLLAFELALRGFALGKATDGHDAFAGFSDIQPLFVINGQAGRYEIPKSRQSHFQPESFLAKKPANEFRIFVLGGSTVQGRPWSIETSFTTWLELHLNAADPPTRYEVVNCGGVSYASYRLIPILSEVLKYQPDLIVFCEGHNEFLEDRCFAPLKSQAAAITWAQRQAAKLRTHNVVREGLRNVASGAQRLLGPEVDARLDWKNGMDAYHRDPAWQAEIIAQFEHNLRQIVHIADSAGVPLVLVNPVSNLEFAPFKSEHRAGITAQESAQVDQLLEQASELYAVDLEQALGVLQKAAAIDDQYAQVHFEIGTCFLEMGRVSQARAALMKAKEMDICPLRMLEPMKQVIQGVADETGTPLVDAEALIAGKSRSGFPDRQWLVDHVHPSMSGHQLIGDALAEKLTELRLVQRQAGWEGARDKAYKEHVLKLDHVYFQRGMDRLKSEQGWAHGLAPAVRAD